MPVSDGNAPWPQPGPDRGFQGYTGDPKYPGVPAGPAGQPPYSPYPSHPPYPPTSPYPPNLAYPPSTFPTPDPASARRYGRVGRAPWTLRQTLLGTALTIVPWLALIILSQASGAKQPPPTQPVPRQVDAITGIISLIFTVIIEGAFLIAPLIYAVARRPAGATARDGLRALGFRRAPLLPAAGWVIGSFATMLLVVYPVYQFVVDHFHLQLQTNVQVLEQQARYAPLTVLCTLIGAVFIAPVCEEIFFRGYLFAGLLRGMNVFLATLVSALLFTLVHGDIGSAAPLLAFAVLLALVRWRTGSIWPGIVLHALNNGLAALIFLPLIFHTPLT